jgi:hypothetical protein
MAIVPPAPPTFSIHRLAERRAHRLGDQARRGVGRAAGRERHDERHRLGRERRLRRRDARESGQRGRRDQPYHASSSSKEEQSLA